MVTIFIGMLAVAWISVGSLVFLERRRDGKADRSVVSFRNQLSTLERATPGTVMRESLTGPVPMVKVEEAPVRASSIRRRRRDVLTVLAGFNVFTLMLVVVVPSVLSTFLFLAATGAFGAYVYALRQLNLRAKSRSRSVRAVAPVEAVDVPVETGPVAVQARILPQSFAN